MKTLAIRSSATSLVFLCMCSAFAAAQQVADTSFRPEIAKPAYASNKGPLVLIDEAHQNFHTAMGRYLPFAELLRRDGYVVKSSTEAFTSKSLQPGKILVMANAASALTEQEVHSVRDWVAEGGALLLIADHPPFDVAGKQLGAAFGVRFSGGVPSIPSETNGRLVFRKADGTLARHVITTNVNEVATFTGTSFQIDKPAEPVLLFAPTVRLRMDSDPDLRSVQGHAQGAVLRVGKGRVAIFGEAAMFSAQLSGPQRNPMGMNAPIAKDNVRLLLNVIHWLNKLGD